MYRLLKPCSQAYGDGSQMEQEWKLASNCFARPLTEAVRYTQYERGGTVLPRAQERSNQYVGLFDEAQRKLSFVFLILFSLGSNCDYCNSFLHSLCLRYELTSVSKLDQLKSSTFVLRSCLIISHYR